MNCPTCNTELFICALCEMLVAHSVNYCSGCEVYICDDCDFSGGPGGNHEAEDHGVLWNECGCTPGHSCLVHSRALEAYLRELEKTNPKHLKMLLDHDTDTTTYSCGYFTHK